MWSWTDIDLFFSDGHVITLFANEREAMKEVPWLGWGFPDARALARDRRPVHSASSCPWTGFVAH
jgi:hypothetical protein